MNCASVNRVTPARRISLILCSLLGLAFMISARLAYADSTFLLQLGTFDSETLASQKWDEVKAKNADILGNLTLHVAEVSLPPAKKTSYRAQVGPVHSREQARSLCDSLQSRDVQCNVVETALFGSGDPEPEVTKEAAPETEPKAAEAPAHNTRALASEEEDTSHMDDPDYVPPPVDSGPVIISSSEAPAMVAPADIAEMPAALPAHAAPVAAPAPVVAAEKEPEPETAPAPVKTPVREHYINGRQPRFLDAPSETTVAAATPAAPAPRDTQAAQPAAKTKEAPGFFARLFSSSPPEPSATEGVVGSVNVGEAVRVPLSSDEQPVRRKIVPVIPEPQGSGMPAESTDKTLWAQISYFRDEAQALTFYRQFSAAYPQYSDGMRIRITRPFGASHAGRVSLRVGPFAGTDDARSICGVAARWSARCTVVRDIGASAAMGAAPRHAARNERATPRQEHDGKFWAQLGTFHSSLEAWDTWRELKSTHRKLAARMHPFVATPPASSAAEIVYRLRAGPYSTQERANAACTRLQEVGQDCLVVNDR